MPAIAEAPTFAISGFELSGNSLLSDSELQSLLRPYVGENKNFETIQSALKALESSYAQAGYATVRAMLPEQEIDSGRIKLVIVEARLGKIAVEGNKHFADENIRAANPSLVAGEVPQMHLVGYSLRVANENPSKQTNLVFRASPRDAEVDALLRVVDENPLKLGVSLDNTGTDATGNYRLGLLLQHANLFNADHIASAQVITSPGHQADVQIIGLGYKLPLYRLGDSIDFAYGYSNVDSGSVSVAGSTLGISGRGSIASARYNVYLPIWNDWDHKLSFGIDYRAYDNKVAPVGGGASLIPDISVRPLSLTYSGILKRAGYDVAGYLTYAQNISGISDGGTDDFENSRRGASAHYRLLRYGVNSTIDLPSKWSLRAAITGQHTSDLLVSGEQFGVGGFDSVRGFHEREIANDKGLRGSIEVYTPDLASVFGRENIRTRALFFYDAARVLRNRPAAGEQRGESIASAGVGLRASIGRSLNLRLDYGVVTDAGGSRRTGEGRLHGSVLWFF